MFKNLHITFFVTVMTDASDFGDIFVWMKSMGSCLTKPKIKLYHFGNEPYLMQFWKQFSIIEKCIHKINSIWTKSLMRDRRLVVSYFCLSKWILFSVFSSKFIFCKYFEKTVPKPFLWMPDKSIPLVRVFLFKIKLWFFESKNKNQSSFRDRIFDLINPFMQPTKSAKVS